ncbi:phenoloxidase-activating factor 3-like [Anthonomus grandis grandis]|uniref:phenoloxidase-activating factor 3-like n=1 Tax=Anthonomus grandis grandis TaxID=2921223 RepID=UPI002165774A|nr:phenoloxidase-activating factor 3-like [Anthonomus grandis grandis]XP_050305449.1 phenoloxidase-activating factor 3-like [Anthonomus grandis grandis]
MCEVKKVRLLAVYLVVLVVGVVGNDFTTRRLRKRAICPPSSECVPLSSCPILSSILDNQCVLENKLAEVSCGSKGSGLICCPHLEIMSINQIGNIASTVIPGKFVDGVRCGQSQVEGEGYDGIGAYPWVVRIGFRNTLSGEIKFPCTGSIISSKVVLTAAHCALAKADNYKLSMIRAGEFSTNTDIDCGEEFCGLPVQDIPISHVIVHPGYEKQTYSNNIALLALKSKIKYGVTTQPICLPESWSVTGTNAVLIGWGKTAGQTETPYNQQHLFLPITSLSQCDKVYGKTLPITDDQICAGGQSGQDACSGFGGAPLLVKHSDTYYQVGILSYGSDQCGAPGIPSVYTNTKKYVSWIRENSPQRI